MAMSDTAMVGSTRLSLRLMLVAPLHCSPGFSMLDSTPRTLSLATGK
jgi:hypothetical protein